MDVSMRRATNSFTTHSLYALASIALIAALSPCFAGIFGSGSGRVPQVANQIAKFSGADNITGMDFSADGTTLAVAALGDTVFLWNWQHARIERKLEDTRSGMNIASQAIRFSQDGQFLASCHGLSTTNTVVRIWNAQKWTVVHDLPGAHACNAIDFSPDGKTAILILLTIPAAPPESSFAVYNITDWQMEWTLATAPFYTSTLALSTDGRFAAIGGHVANPKVWPYKVPVPTFGTPPLPDMNLIGIVDLENHAIANIIQHTVNFTRGKISWRSNTNYIAAIGSREWDGSKLTGSPDTMSVFEASSGRRIDGEQMDEPGNVEVRYTSDDKYLIETEVTGLRVGSGIRIWDSQHHALLQTIAGEYAHLAVSRDGHHFAVNDDNKIYVFDLK
jgi:WD40 repeat protein